MRATGTVAVIDVFRAFTTAAVALANRASRIVMVRSVEEALALRDAGIGQICMGEVRGQALDRVEFGNSPFEISSLDFTGKTIIQRTSAGTQGIVLAASRAERLYAASLVTAETTVCALLSGSPDQVSLVAMGDNGIKRTDADELCAIHLRNRLEPTSLSFDLDSERYKGRRSITEDLRTSASSRQYAVCQRGGDFLRNPRDHDQRGGQKRLSLAANGRSLWFSQNPH